MESIEKSMIAV